VAHFIDANPSQFNKILDYYRYGVVALPSERTMLEELAIQADYFLLCDLATAARQRSLQLK